MNLSEPVAIVLGAFITAVFGVLATWVASRVQRKKAPQRKQAKDAWVNELIERICAVYERQIAWQQEEIERRDGFDATRDRADVARDRSDAARDRADIERRGSPRRGQQP